MFQPEFVVSHGILDSLELQESKEWLSNHTTYGLVAQPLVAFLELQASQRCPTDSEQNQGFVCQSRAKFVLGCQTMVAVVKVCSCVAESFVDGRSILGLQVKHVDCEELGCCCSAQQRRCTLG